jgi:transglycosylase-like protein with SLT domain
MALEDQYDSIFEEAGREWNIHPSVLKAVMRQETGGNRTKNGKPITSTAGAGGLMQIMPDTATHLGVTDVHDPRQAIFGAAKYLRENLDDPRFGNSMEHALGAYNAGPDKYADYLAGRRSLSAETRAYIPAVTSHYNAFAKAQPVATQPAGGMTADDIVKRYGEPAAPTTGPTTAAPKTDGMTADDILKAYQTPEGSKLAVTPTQSPPKPAAPAVASAPYDTAPPLGEGAVAYDTGTPVPASTGDTLRSPATILTAMKEGAVRGFQNTPDILSPQASEWLNAHGLGAIGNHTGLPSYALKTLAGGFNALQSGIAQAGTVAGVPQLGRDLAAFPEAFAPGLPGNPLIARPMARAAPLAADIAEGAPVRNPLLSGPAPNPLASTEAIPAFIRRGVDPLATRSVQPPVNPLVAAPQTIIPAPAFVPPGSQVPVLPRVNALLAEDQRIAATRPAQIPPGTAVDPLTGRVIPIQQPGNPLSSGPATVPYAAPAPVNPLSINPASAAPAAAEPAALRSVGAAASRDLSIEPLPAQTGANVRTNLQKDVLQTVEDRAPNGVDNEVYVPGVERPLAAREFSPQNSVDEKTLRQSDPLYDAHYKAIEKKNNETMVDHIREVAGDPNALQEAYDARESVAPPAQQLFAAEKPVDAAPLVAHVDSILASPAGKRGAVTRVLNDVREKLFDQDGNLETLPSQLYGARQNITDWLRKGAGTGDLAGDAKLAKSQLGELLPIIDRIIGEGAPKFPNYLKEFSEASKPIDQIEFLQTYMTGAKKVTDANGYLQLNKVQKMLDDIYQGISKPAINKAKSLTDEQIQRIVAVRNELQANEYKDRLARTKGSDTQQLTNRSGFLGEGPLGTAVRGAGDLAVHGALAMLPGGGFTNALYGAHRNIVGPALKARTAVKQAAALDVRKAQLLSTAGNPLSSP